MAEQNAPNRVEQRTAPSTAYTVEGSPEDYRYVLRGADLVLIDKNNEEHIFLFVGNIMSLDGKVDMTFSNGVTLHSSDLFERSEMVDVQPFYEEEVEWDAQDESDPKDQKEGNTPTPDGAEGGPTEDTAQNVQAKPTENLKQQLMQALKENENTSQKHSDDVRNENVAAQHNTNTSDKQGGADNVDPEKMSPTLAPPHISLTDDTNSGSKLDSVTNITTPHFKGTAEPDSELTLYIDDVPVATGTASTEGEFLFLLDTTYTDGTYSVHLTSEKYGLTAQTEILPLEIDTVPPALPSIHLAEGYDTGKSDTDKLINDPRPGFEGSYTVGDTSEAGTTLTVQYREHGMTNFKTIGTTTVQEDGTWSYRLPAGSALGNGRYDFQLMAEDVAGNRTDSGTAVLLDVRVDTIAPLLGTELTLDEDSFNPDMTGTDSDFITKDSQFELSGTAEDESIVRVYLGNLMIGETTVTGGTWDFAPGAFNFGSQSVVGNSAVLADGSYELSVVAFDEAGNQSAKVERTLVIDTTIDAPEISIAGMVDAVEGVYYIGETNPQFTVSGETYSSGTFTLIDKTTGLPVADDVEVLWDQSSNSYTFASPGTLTSGRYVASFSNTDAAGNSNSTTLEFQVETDRPPSPLLSVEDTGAPQTSGDPITNNPALTISFAPGARLDNIKDVRVYLDGNNPPDLDNDTFFLATKQGDSWVLSPEFNLGLQTALNDGYSGTTTDFFYTVVVMDRAGRADKLSGETFESTSFVYDTVAPVISDFELVTNGESSPFAGIPDDYKVDLDNAALTDADRAEVDVVGAPIYVVPVNPSFKFLGEVDSYLTVILGDDVNSDPHQTDLLESTSWTTRFGDTAQSESFALVKGEMNKVTIQSTDKAGNISEEVLFIKVAGAPPAAPSSVKLVDEYNTGSDGDDITRGLDDDTPEDKADNDGVIRLQGNASGAAYVKISYVDENGVTQTVKTAAGSDRIPVQADNQWQSPDVLLTDTSTTTHLGTEYTFSVVAYDAANQPSLETTTYPVTIDRTTTMPTIDLDSDSAGPSGSATMDYGTGLTGSTDDRTSLTVENNVLTLKGANAEDGGTVWLLHTFNGSTQELDFAEYRDSILESGGETGEWSIDLTTTDIRLSNDFTTDGVHTFVVRSMDKAGNIVDSAPLSVTFDSTAPGVSSEALDPAQNSSLDERFILANPALDALDDTYAADTVTRNPDFTLTGALTAEATDEADNVAVRVFKDGFQIGVADVVTDANGDVSWTYDFSSGLAEGSRQDYTFHVEVQDRAGNTTTGDNIVITVDREPPQISNFELLDTDDSYYDAANPANDLGNDADNYTNSPTLTLVGSSDVAAPVLLEYSLDGGSTYQSLFAIPNGSEAASGSNWTQNGSGDWTYTVNVDLLSAGLGTTATENILFRATASDAAGNEISDSFPVSIDRLAPSGTTIDLDTSSDSSDVLGDSIGESDIGSHTDNRTNADSVLLTGSAEAGARVEIYRVEPGATFNDGSAATRGTLLKVVTADSVTGAWNHTHAFDTDPAGGVDADGEYDFVAVAVDSAGNRSSAATVPVHRDTEVETTPTLDISDHSYIDSANLPGAGSSSSNPVISAGTHKVDSEGHTYLEKSVITLEGELQGYDGAVDPVAVYVYQNGSIIGKATITGTTWSYEVSSLQDATSYAFSLKVEDSAGNTVETAPLYVKIDTSTEAPSLDLIDDDDTSGSLFYSDTSDPLQGGEDDVTNPGETLTDQNNSDNAFTLEGDVAEAGSTVKLYVSRSLGDGTYTAYEEVLGTVTQPSGAGTGWSCIVPDTDISDGDGTYRFKAIAQDAYGNTSEKTLDVVVDSHAPSLLNAYELWLDNDSGAQDLKTNTSTLELHGRLSDTSDQDIVLYIEQDGGTPIRIPSANINWTTGEWSFEYTPTEHHSAGPDLPEGQYSFTLYAEDRAGNLTTYPPGGGTFDVEIDRTLSSPSITLSEDSNTYGGPARADLDHDGDPDGASDDYTGFVSAHGTNIFLDIDADSDATVSVYVKDPSQGDVPINVDNLGNAGSGYVLCQNGITYNTTADKWDTFTFDASDAGYQNDTNEVTLVVVANDGGQTKYSTYSFTLDDEAPVAEAGNAINWEPADDTSSHITSGDVITNATNDKSILLSGAVVGEGRNDVTVEIFDSTKSTLTGGFGARVSLGMATVNAAGEWTFEVGSDASPIAEVFHEFTARIEDRAGNVREVSLGEILVDRGTPVEPGLAMIGTEDTDYTDGFQTETGGDGYYHDDNNTPTSADDIYYNDNNLTEFKLSGLETDPGSVLTILVDGVAQPSVAITGTEYTYQPSGEFAEGSHTIEAYVTDAAGNESAKATMNFEVDTVNPGLQREDIRLAADSNTGSADDTDDPVTNAEHPVIEGVSEAGAAISVELTNEHGTVYVAKTIAGSDGSWSVAANSGAAIEAGTYDVSVTAIDKAGNTTVLDHATSFEVNREVSVTDNTFRMVENSENDTGFADNDQYTKNTGPSFSWEATEDVTAQFVFYKNGIASPVKTAIPRDGELHTVGGVTTWTPADLDLTDGEYTVKAVFIDTEAGNETDPDDNTVDFIIDTTPTTLSAELTSDSGIQNDWVTNPAEVPGADGSTVTIEGSAPAGTPLSTQVRIQIFSKGGDGSLTLLSPENGVGGHDYMEIAGDGTWTYVIDSADLPVGGNDLVIIATDQAGNQTTIEQTLEIDTDVTAGTVVLASESNSGTYEADGDFIDNKTNDATPRLTGTAEPNATVDLYLGDPDGGGTLIGRDIPTDAEGNWYFDVDTDTRTDGSGLLRQAVINMDDTSADLNGTSYSFVARVTDRADNVADATGTIVLDTQAPDEGAAYGRILPTPITVGTQTVYSDTGLDHTDGYTSDTRPTLIGEVPEGHSRVDVYITYPGDDPANPTLVGTTKADANGDWELEFPDSATPLAGAPLGTEYQVSVRTWDDAGNQSDYSGTRTIAIDSGFEDLDANLGGLQPALIRFNSDFNDDNPPANGADPVSYDESDHTLKTNLTNPVFDITLEPDCDTVTLTLIRLDGDGNPVTTPVADQDIFVINLGPGYAENPPADGNWSGVAFKTSDGQFATINGNWLLTLEGTDKAGNSFSLEDNNALGGQLLTVNGIPPEFDLTIVEDQAGDEGHGLYAGDSILNAPSVHFSGTFGDDVDFNEISNVSIINSVTNEVIRTLTADEITDRTWTMEAKSVVDEGASSFSFYVRAQDNFGNEFWYPSASEPLTYTVDRNGPTLNEDSVDLVDGDDSFGIFHATNEDNVTTETTPRIEFGSEENAKVELFLDGELLFTAMPPDPSVEGAEYTYALGSDPLGSGLPAGVTYNAATRRYTFTSDTLTDGDYTFTLRATDLAGNSRSRDLAVTVDRVYENDSLTADLSSASDKGMFGDSVAYTDDNLSNEGRPELFGRAEAGSAVRIYMKHFDTKAEAEADTDFSVGDADWYNTTPHHEIELGDMDTSWSWNAENSDHSELDDGYYKVIVVSEDQAGNRPLPETFVFGKDTDAPSEAGDAVPLTFHLQDKIEGADQVTEGSESAGEVQRADGEQAWFTSNWMPTIGGNAEAGSQVHVVLRIDSDLDGNLDDPTAIYKNLTIDVTDPSGAWSFDFAGEATGAGRLADGLYTATVTCIDPAGNSTTMDPSPQFEIRSTPPSPPTIRLDHDDDSYDEQTSNDGITNQRTNLTITGTAEAGAVVRLYRSEARANTSDLITNAYLEANIIATLTANASGEWSYEIPANGTDPDTGDPIVTDGSYRYFVAGDYFNGNTYYSIQATNAEGHAVTNDDGSPVLKDRTPIPDSDEFTYPDYVLEVDTQFDIPTTFELGLTLDTDTSLSEEERRVNSSRMDSGIDNDWRTPEEIAAGVNLGEPSDFWKSPDEFTGDSSYNDWRVKTSGPTIEGKVEAGSIVYIERFMHVDLTDDGFDNPLDQWVTVGIVDQDSTSEGTWRFVFPAEHENAVYTVRIRAVDKAGNRYQSDEKEIVIDAEIKNTVFDLTDVQDTELHWAGVAAGTAWEDIAADATLEGLDYVQKGHLPTAFESGNADDLTTENNLLLSGEVEAGSRMYLTDTRQGVTVPITPVLVLDPAAMLNDDSATEAYYVKTDDAGDVGTWVWKSAAQFTADHGADYGGIYFHISNDGTWEYQTGALEDVKHAYTIENIDLAGNRAVTTPLAVEIDHEFSNAAIALSMSSDTGPFGDNDPAYDDRITSDGTPSFRLYGDSGATYLVYAYHVNEDGTLGANINADGTPVVTGVYGEASDTYVTIPLADGGYQFRLVNVSESGHVSEAIYPPTEADDTYVTNDHWDEGGSTHPLVIDTVAPVIRNLTDEGVPGYYAHVEDQDPGDPNNAWTQPVLNNGRPLPIIISGDAVDVDGNGVIADLITTDNTPEIQVFVEPGTMIAVSGMGYSSYLTDHDNDGIIVLDPSEDRNSGNPYANGSYHLRIRFGDIAGNISDSAHPMEFDVVIDSSAPSANIALESDPGTSSSDNLVNVTDPVLTGRVSADAIRYEITVGDMTIDRHIGDGDYGNLITVDGVEYYEWTYQPTLANGEYNVSITAWDRAGNAQSDGLNAFHPDDPNTVTNDVPLIIHETGELPIYASCESNRSGTRFYLDIDYSVSDAYNDSGNAYAGSNQLIFTYHYTDNTSSTEVVEMALGETDYSNSLRASDGYSSIDFKLVDSAGNESATGHVDLTGSPADGVYEVENVTGTLSEIPETVDVGFRLSGSLSDHCLTDDVEPSDVATIRATITGDIDGDGTSESIIQNVAVADDHSWALNFSRELAADERYDLDLSALSADGTEISLALDQGDKWDLSYDFRVLTEQMEADAGAASQVIFEGTDESKAPAPPPETEDCVTIDVGEVHVDEYGL